MRLAFERLVGPLGIPIYFQPVPAEVGSLSLCWVMYTGSADDETVGAPGLYHWFEHVPFRGTRHYPGGYAETQGQFTIDAGKNGAWTNTFSTCHWATIPKQRLKDGLAVITDLMGQPLLEKEGIEAERQIIGKEIAQRLSTAQGNAWYRLGDLLFPHHPYGHHVLGSEESLASIDPEKLLTAWHKGYDRSRAVLFVSGDVDRDELLDLVHKYANLLPHNFLTERRGPATYGPLPQWTGGRVTEIETSFSSSVVKLLFPVPKEEGEKRYFGWTALKSLCDLGGLNSPLYRIVREERKLAYGTGGSYFLTADGGFWGLSAETSRENIDALVQAFWDVLSDKELRSSDRLGLVRHYHKSVDLMRPINPDQFTDVAIERLALRGSVMSDVETVRAIHSVGREALVYLLDQLTPDRAHIIVFKGK